MADNSKDRPEDQGIFWLQGATPEIMESFPKLAARDSDIYIVAYPRSGSTWTEEIVWQILHNGEMDSRLLDVRVPYIEGMILPVPEYPFVVSNAESMGRMFESFPLPRVFKTHLPYDLVPKGRDDATKPRYIYVMRNPKDIAVSYYHHLHNMPYLTEILTWNELIGKFINGKVFGASWFDHVLNWWSQQDDPNILFVKYEDRVKDSRSAIQQIAQFLGKELSPETLELIVKQTSFSAMKQSESTNFSWFKGIKGDGHIRKGQVGGWREYFTEEQNELFDKVFEEKMAGTGLEFEYKQ